MLTQSSPLSNSTSVSPEPSHLPEASEVLSENVPATQQEAGEKSFVSSAASEPPKTETADPNAKTASDDPNAKTASDDPNAKTASDDPNAKTASDEDTLIVMDSDSDDLDDETAATLNNLTLNSLQRRVQSGAQPSAPTHSRNCLSEDYSHVSPQSPLEASFSFCPLLQLIHESDVGLSHAAHSQDATRLQLVLILLSSFHQSVYSGITAYAQNQVLQNKTDASVSGYFLCNQQYAIPVLQALCEVLRGPHLRPVTTQCSLYVMRYLLTNHVYGDTLPFSVFQDLAGV